MLIGIIEDKSRKYLNRSMKDYPKEPYEPLKSTIIIERPSITPNNTLVKKFIS